MTQRIWGWLGRWLVFVAFVALGWWLVFGGSKPALHVLASAEHQPLQPLIDAWARDNGVAVSFEYVSDADIAERLRAGPAAFPQGETGAGQAGSDGFDAVWPAASVWLALGDRDQRLRYAQSILRSPVVVGLKRSLAETLGWIGRDVSWTEVVEAAAEGRLRLVMAPPGETPGALALLSAMRGSEDQSTALLAVADRADGAEAAAAAMVDYRDRYDGLVAYEALMIRTNLTRVQLDREPLQVFYPAESVEVADGPLAFLPRQGGSDSELEAAKQAFFALQRHLLSPRTQDVIVSFGRRPGLAGLDLSRADPRVWNREWGVALEREFEPTPPRERAAIEAALNAADGAPR